MLTGLLILACWVFLVVYWNISARSIKPTSEGQDWNGRLARMPIWLGYILFVVIWTYPFGIVVIRRTAVSGSLAVVICALGLIVSIWSRRALGSEWSRDVELKQGHKLVEQGPYAFVRHPIYTGHLLCRPVHRVSVYRRLAICSARLPLGAAKHIALATLRCACWLHSCKCWSQQTGP
jgi:protein-S-isoprenylcysteine O-methyltransferase Ste14